MHLKQKHSVSCVKCSPLCLTHDQIETECHLWKYASDKPKPLKFYLDSWWKCKGL